MFWKRPAAGLISLELPDGSRWTWRGEAREVLRLAGAYEGAHGHSGLITIIRRDEETGAVEVASFRNLITNVGKNLDRDGYGGFISDRQIKWVAVGTGTNAPAATDTALGAEVLRVAPVKWDNTGSTGVLVTTATISPSQLVGTAIGELGWFAGASATSASGSGSMVARVLYSHTKTANESLSIQRTDTYS